MLVLSRQRGERLLIGDDIVIEVAEIRGDKVRLGVTAPRDVPVDRPEIRDRKQMSVPCAPRVRPQQPDGRT